MESSGCGSRMILPSFVRFFSGTTDLMECLDTLLSEGGYGEGKEEAEVRALACWRPRGSLCLWTLDRSKIEPRKLKVSMCSMDINHELHFRVAKDCMYRMKASSSSASPNQA